MFVLIRHAEVLGILVILSQLWFSTDLNSVVADFALVRFHSLLKSHLFSSVSNIVCFFSYKVNH